MNTRDVTCPGIEPKPPRGWFTVVHTADTNKDFVATAVSGNYPSSSFLFETPDLGPHIGIVWDQLSTFHLNM
jgi:hypothetical protein